MNALIRHRRMIRKTTVQLGLTLGSVCIFFGIMSLFGYAIGTDILYRPIVGGPATHPVTAILVVLCGLNTTCYMVRKHQAFWLVLATLALLILFVKAIDIIAETHLIDTFTPFSATVAMERELGMDNNIGNNTALYFFLFTLATIARVLRKTIYCQALTFLSLALPTLSLTGYTYGIDDIYGQMSLFTTFFAYSLSTSMLCLTCETGVVRALMSSNPLARWARIQAVLGYLIPFGLGYVFVQTIIATGHAGTFSVLMVVIIWLIIALTACSAYLHERAMRLQRIREHKLEEAAHRDPLTGLINRSYFYELAYRELNRLQRNNTKDAWLLMIDADHFKKVNDSAGHIIGDKVLISIAEKLKKSVRNIDLVCRLGGEEFAILLTDASARNAQVIAERIRKNVEAINVFGYTDRIRPITVSIGVTNMDISDSINLEKGISNADAALYQAKSKGRNQVVIQGLNSVSQPLMKLI